MGDIQLHPIQPIDQGDLVNSSLPSSWMIFLPKQTTWKPLVVESGLLSLLLVHKSVRFPPARGNRCFDLRFQAPRDSAARFLSERNSNWLSKLSSDGVAICSVSEPGDLSACPKISTPWVSFFVVVRIVFVVNQDTKRRKGNLSMNPERVEL